MPKEKGAHIYIEMMREQGHDLELTDECKAE